MKKTNNAKTFYVIGAKWFDKLNGNTYCNAKIIDSEGNRFYSGYTYGYGNYYLHHAENYIKDNLTNNFNIIDCGYFYIKHKDIKNNNF